MASKNHILLVFENFNIDQHGLLKEDINVKDKKKITTTYCAFLRREKTKNQKGLRSKNNLQYL